MARGARQTALNMAQGGYNSAQGFNTGLEGQNAALQNYLVPQYQELIKNPGYTQEQKNALTLNTTGAAGAAFGGASDAAAREAARTGNEAGLGSNLDALAQKKAQTMASVNAGNQETMANAARSDVRTGLSGLSGLYGMDTNLLGRSLGIPPEYLNAYNKNVPGLMDSLLPMWVQGGAQVGAAAAGGG